MTRDSQNTDTLTPTSSDRFYLLKNAGLLILVAGTFFSIGAFWGWGKSMPLPMMLFSVGFIVTGSILYITGTQLNTPPGIKNNYIVTSGMTSRGFSAWIIGILLTGFYIFLYWFPSYLTEWVHMFTPLSQMLRNKNADQWFLYSTFYSISVLIMGYRFILKYRHSRYQIIRTISVMFFQLVLAYIIPSLMILLNQPEYYLSYFWPLTYNALFPSTFEGLKNHPGGIGIFLFSWGAIMTFLITPIFTYFYGKRWYCSWVCGCGGLANTMGDPFRQLSSKKRIAWKIERISIYSVLVFITLTTLLLWVNVISGGAVIGKYSMIFSKTYGFLIGAAFAGVIGVGFYPILGSRVWCRFGCPQAAILGILQKIFSRFRITTNGGQCISCGNCSKYCEMGIDVRWYAQKGQNIVRASCVGCGICSAVCPRGVLNLEAGPIETRGYSPYRTSKAAPKQ